MGTAADVVEVGAVDDDADGEVGVVVVGEDPRGAFGRPLPCASASPGSASPMKTNRAAAEGRERYVTATSATSLPALLSWSRLLSSSAPGRVLASASALASVLVSAQVSAPAWVSAPVQASAPERCGPI